MFVKIKDDNDFSERKIGKVIVENSDICVIEFFDNPVDPPEQLEVPRDNFVYKKIPFGSRVFYFHENSNAWFVGKILENETWLNGYTKKSKIKLETVHLPDDLDQVLTLSPEKFVTRHYIPLADPTSFLQRKITENKQYFDSRSQYQECLMNYRSISKGVDSIFSANINLEEHQIDIATRVLQDPIQRYLLGDEVGLGKTIEAAIIIRQFVLDFPTSHRVLIVCPRELQIQWQYELAFRFNLNSSMRRGFIKVLYYEELEEISTLLRRSGINKIDMIVVDEAHRLTRKNYNELYNRIKFHGGKLNRFLLLSGTPVLNNEKGFLEMLELLDPDIYSISNADKFKNRINNRTRISEIVDGLDPVAKLVMKTDLLELEAMFPDDQNLAKYLKDLIPILDDYSVDEGDPVFLNALGVLREYIAQSFKLDQRILRTRRQSVSALTPSREGIEVFTINSSDAQDLYSSLDEIRLLCGSLPSTQAKKDLRNIFFTLVSYFIQGSISRLLGQKLLIKLRRTSHKFRFNKQTSAILQTITDHTENLLEKLVNRDLIQKYEKVLEILTSKHETKVIIFCSDEESAKRLKKFLDEELDNTQVVHGEDSTRVNKYFQTQDKNIVAIFDRHSEEGLNLQGEGRFVIHLDLPLDPNRIEQRIGRVDRYGGANFKSSLVIDESNMFEFEWKNLVIETIRVFNRSIASLQFLIEEQMKIMKDFFFQQGIHAFNEMSEKLGGPKGLIDIEFRKILMQENLDAIHKPFYEDFEKIKNFDEDLNNIRTPIYNWTDTLQIQIRPRPNIGDEIFKFYRTNYCKIALDNYVENLVEKEDTNYPEGHWRRYPSSIYTYSRKTALNRVKDNKTTFLIRPGDKYFLGLDGLTDNDDRGRVFGVVREVKFSINTQVFLCFEFRVDVDVEKTVDFLIENNVNLRDEKRKSVHLAMKRFGDAFLNPSLIRVWVNQEEEIETKKEILDLLDRPYQKNLDDTANVSNQYRDVNLTFENWRFVEKNQFPRLDTWDQFLSNSKQVASRSLKTNDSLKRNINKAETSFSISMKQKVEQLENRLRNIEGLNDELDQLGRKNEYAKYKIIEEHLNKGIKNPDVQLVGSGVMFLRKKPGS